MLESRIIASSVPRMMPPVIASTVSVTVKVMPSLKRYPAERAMTSQSKPVNMLVARLGRTPGRDQPGHRDLPLEPAHAEHDDDVHQDVDDRRGGERLEHLEAELLHRARARGELHQADGQRNRRVLDDVQEL